MTGWDERFSPVTAARVTGLLYLLIIVLGLFGELGVRGRIVAVDDPLATAEGIRALEGLLRVGFSAEVLVFLADVAVAVLLYVLLRPVSETLALLAAAFRLVGTAVYTSNLLFQMAALVTVGRDAGAGLDPTMLREMAYVFMELHGVGYDLGLVFFGVHCLVLAYLLVRSPWFPGLLGVLMLLAGTGYLVGSFTRFLAPALVDAVAWVYVAPLVGELALTGWLLVRGIRLETSAPG